MGARADIANLQGRTSALEAKAVKASADNNALRVTITDLVSVMNAMIVAANLKDKVKGPKETR